MKRPWTVGKGIIAGGAFLMLSGIALFALGLLTGSWNRQANAWVTWALSVLIYGVLIVLAGVLYSIVSDVVSRFWRKP